MRWLGLRRISDAKASLGRDLSSLGVRADTGPTFCRSPASKLPGPDLARAYLAFLIGPTSYALFVAIGWLLRGPQASLELWQAICELLALDVHVTHGDELVLYRWAWSHLASRIRQVLGLLWESVLWRLVWSTKGAH